MTHEQLASPSLFAGRRRRRLSALASAIFSLEPAGSRDEAIAARRRAAQIAVVARYAPTMVGANIANALVLVAALRFRGSCPLALPWLAAMLLYFTPLAYRMSRRRHKSAPAAVSRKAVERAAQHAAILGMIWGAAPILFFDSGLSDKLVIVSIVVGMMCGGALALATLPQAVLAFSVPLALGSLIGLLRGAHEPIDYFIVPLLISYFVVVVLAALAHGRQFATRVVAQARAEMEARHDPLTGLPNRAAFDAALSMACMRIERYGERFAIFYIDLDDFKLVNDRYGHQAGDHLLKQMAGRLAGCLRDNDLLARLGGDEFVLLARGVADAQAASQIAERLAQAFEAAFVLDGGSLDCRASVGVALAPGDGATPAALLSHADTALYGAKRDREVASRLYHRREDSEMRTRRSLMQDMKGALARGEFFLQFQPIQNLATSHIESNETLARWRHPVRGLVPPAQFISVAESVGMIHELGEWIMFEACREAARWPDDVHVAVNVSPDQICDHSIVAIVQAALREARLAPHRLHVEVTESAMLAAASGTAAAIERLHERGVSIILDDFGMGFSSFDHIRRLPVKGLKIDRSFVSELPERKSRAIVQAVCHLANELDLDVTAEGIETVTQRDFVKAAGCRFGQGYLLSRPQDAEAVRAMMTRPAAA